MLDLGARGPRPAAIKNPKLGMLARTSETGSVLLAPPQVGSDRTFRTWPDLSPIGWIHCSLAGPPPGKPGPGPRSILGPADSGQNQGTGQSEYLGRRGRRGPRSGADEAGLGTVWSSLPLWAPRSTDQKSGRREGERNQERDPRHVSLDGLAGVSGGGRRSASRSGPQSSILSPTAPFPCPCTKIIRPAPIVLLRSPQRYRQRRPHGPRQRHW